MASHHAGLVPAFKETVEELFAAGLIKVVFATETLALGINMPARSVVLETLSKYDGEGHQPLRPGDYTQLTGRAGRRGIDIKGYGVILHSPFVRFDQVLEIASSGSHRLTSSFRPTYNMTANLVANYPEDEAERLLEASFAAFQREEDRRQLQDRISALEERLAVEEARARCERGSVEEYEAMVESVRPGRQGDRIVSGLRSGHVVDIEGGSRDGRYAILKRLSRKGGGVRFLVLSTSGRLSTVGHRDITPGSRVVGTIELPTPLRPKDRRFREESVRRLRKLSPRRSGDVGVRRRVLTHPVAECPDASHHLDALRRARRTRRLLEQHRSLRRSSGHGLVEEFRAIRALLEELGYLDGWTLKPRGERLRRIYNETDLLLTEAMDRGLLLELDPAELAAMVSVFVYEPRTDTPSAGQWPTEKLERRWEEIDRLWSDLSELESRYRLTPTRRPDPGFALLAYGWARGDSFGQLPAAGLAPGDFVRVSRQLADLLRQLREAAPELEDEANLALRAVDRGVVAAQGVAV